MVFPKIDIFWAWIGGFTAGKEFKEANEVVRGPMSLRDVPFDSPDPKDNTLYARNRQKGGLVIPPLLPKIANVVFTW